ncbi:uncharacterized protein LOC125178359 [Hyalella azteca]|uniref:Uncharacterized protein LOC125178359 n=1 Tax=Hyalella azteca TaxID=294128 RepID=A0A979FMA9_HYAAZ|nr:uncharacterized protein LOC125178359 [Hyalella azteca]
MQGVWGSFRLVNLLASQLSLLAPPPSAGMPASLLHCAGLCLQDERCGGVAWLDNDPQSCRFVVDSTVPGATATLVSSAYAILSTDSSATVVEIPFSGTSWQQAYDFCSGIGLRLVPYPVSLKDRAVMSIRSKTWVSVDLQRRSNGSYTALSSSLVLPANYPFPWYLKNPHYGMEKCLIVGNFPLAVYDFECSILDTAPKSTLCVV